MTAEKFKENWAKNGDSTSPLNSEQLKSFNLSVETVDFLIQSGLPDEASPYLSFVQDSDEEFEQIALLSRQYPFLGPEFEKYVSIGFDGNGDVIVINTKEEDQIEWLDHEDSFSSRFMNSSILQLAQFLIFYRDFTETIIAENGEDAFMDANFTDQQYSVLMQKMNESDPKALESGFWQQELDLLLENRAYYGDKK